MFAKEKKKKKATSFETQSRGRGSLLFSTQRADQMSLYTMREEEEREKEEKSGERDGE